LGHLDPRTKLALGIMAIAAVFVARKPGTLLVEWLLLFICLLALRMGKSWVRSYRLFLPMVGIVFVIAFLSYDVRVAVLLCVRLLNLLTASFIFFRSVSPEEMGDAMGKVGIPYEFSFILTTSMRYVPLIGQKLRNVYDAQRSRGIDLRPRPKNVVNFLALLMPLLAQSFVLSEQLAMAMESRGFGRAGRSTRRHYRLAFWDYGLMALGLVGLLAFAWWEMGQAL
jgi:energy-coupling factor transport system permease protein